MRKLALIGVDGITSRPPGGTLKFTGLDLLVLATVNGSINLTSAVSFQDINELAMYARGAGSDLTINSPISNIGILGLVAEDSIHLANPGTMSVGKLDAITGDDLTLQIGGSLLLNGRVRLDAIVLPGASVASGINLTVNVTGDYTNSSATQFSHLAITNRDHIGGDARIAVGATNISTANDLDVQIVNQGSDRIGENALINVGASNDINVVSDATFQILNDDGGQIGGNGNISVTTEAISCKFHSWLCQQSQWRRHHFGRQHCLRHRRRSHHSRRCGFWHLCAERRRRRRDRGLTRQRLLKRGQCFGRRLFSDVCRYQWWREYPRRCH